MSSNFMKTKPTASFEKVDRYKIRDGTNTIRIFGNLLAKYNYWIDKVPFEDLTFNRETQVRDSAEKDWVKEYYPDLKSQFGYVIQCLDLNDRNNPKVVVFDVKKKLLEQIQAAAVDLAEEGEDPLDPTDLDNGWDIVWDRKKTGPSTMNVAHELRVLKLKKRAVTDVERELILKAKTVEELFPRETPEKQKERLDKIRGGNQGDMDSDISDEFDTTA